MRAHRVIFRFDFAELNYAVFDRMGAVMSLMSKHDKSGSEFLERFRENRDQRSVMGFTRSDSDLVATVLTVEPKTIHGGVESVSGWELARLESVGNLKRALDVSDGIMTFLGVGSLARAGVRVMMFGRPNELELTEIQRRFRGSISTEIVEATEKSLGEITDYAWAFDGLHKDGLSFKVRCGPYTAAEAQNYMKEYPKEFGANEEHNFVIDLDVFEKSFEIPTGQARRWAGSAIERSSKFAKAITSVLADL